MAKKKKQTGAEAQREVVRHDLGKGEIRDNALAAMVTSRLFRAKCEKPKKGKGSYNRKARGRGLEPYPMAA
ncbi:ribosome alternative rescue factor ArfA [Parasalinivibrio latis]|uniref:ribosome alternative rescue factor ArfA n=1 Tax=Parasalinivibrio latis TaxID=2952610 RepID=UPI0030E346BC